MKHEQTIHSLAELVAEQWETIQQKRNYIEYLENELAAKKNLNTSLESENQILCNDNTKFSELIDKLEADVKRLEGELLTQRGLQGETQKKLFEEQELRRCENELRGEKVSEHLPNLSEVIKKTAELKNIILSYNDGKSYSDEMIISVNLNCISIFSHPYQIQLTKYENAETVASFDKYYDEAYSRFDGVKVFTLNAKEANS